MLTHLVIRDIAVVREARIDFGLGLNALTGESGAGKSVVVDALSLLRGQSRSRATPREGARFGEVEAQFVEATTGELADVERLLGQYDLPFDGEIVLRRRLEDSGRTRSYVQGRLVPRSVLAEVGSQLVEICGQHESHAFRSAHEQLHLLDRFADVEERRAVLSGEYRLLRQLDAKLEELDDARAEAERRRDFIEFQLSELRELDLDRYAEDRERVTTLREAARVTDLCQMILGSLREADDSIEQRLAWLRKRAMLLDAPPVAALLDSLSVIEEGIDAAARCADATLEALLGGEDVDDVEARVTEVERLARKHRREPDELLDLLRSLEGELQGFERADAELPQLQEERSRLESKVRDSAEKLHQTRKAAAARLERAATKELASLGLKGAQLLVRVEPTELGPTGSTAVELRFAAHAAEEPSLLGKVASGGELSRVLLALRIAAGSGFGSLSVFDEIDAGAGGKTAERIGDRLRRAAQGRQVLCITHWPQVAARADVHLLVEKAAGTTRVSALDGGERLAELGRMLGGAEETAQAHAAHLLGRRPPKRRAA